jgi:hypothetical protein
VRRARVLRRCIGHRKRTSCHRDERSFHWGRARERVTSQLEHPPHHQLRDKGRPILFPCTAFLPRARTCAMPLAPSLIHFLSVIRP